MDNYPSNSDKTREQVYTQKHVDRPVISGGARTKEKTWFEKVLNFFGLSECVTFRDYVSALGDMTNRVYGAIDTLISGRPTPGASQVPGARVAYSNCFPQQNTPSNQTGTKMATVSSYSDLEFDYRSDAEVVLFRMNELLQIYPSVSVGDLFDLAGVTDPNGYNNQRYGWNNITGARVVPFGRKFRIVGLPVPVQLG